jgi:3-hydroxyethyl bacteriochlorophyllide a dehydrogenase
VADLRAVAVVFDRPASLNIRELRLTPPTDDQVVVDVSVSGVSTGTERLLWTGEMPPFPGMDYPLVPGYESVGRITHAGSKSGRRQGQLVFVPGARCYETAQGLFGGASSRVVLNGNRTLVIEDDLSEQGVLLALAATAHNILRSADGNYRFPGLIVGHGVLGRLIARLVLALGGRPPVVWEQSRLRREPDQGYEVVEPDHDATSTYQTICDVSGDSSLLDALIGRLSPKGELVLAGFYRQALQFSFPPAFMRQARIRIAAEWEQQDLESVYQLVQGGALSLEGLITHRQSADQALAAYETAFNDPTCLKMILDWNQLPGKDGLNNNDLDDASIHVSGWHH